MAAVLDAEQFDERLLHLISDRRAAAATDLAPKLKAEAALRAGVDRDQDDEDRRGDSRADPGGQG